jgi:hypothetical protein
MKITIQKAEKISRSAPLKVLTIGVLSVLILIPGSLIQNSIRAKKMQTLETVRHISAQLDNTGLRIDGNFLHQKTIYGGDYFHLTPYE